MALPVVPTGASSPFRRRGGESGLSEAQRRDLASAICGRLLKRGPSASRLRRFGRDDGQIGFQVITRYAAANLPNSQWRPGAAANSALV